MKFNHRVKFNGVLYEVGQNVPIEDKKAEIKADMKPQEVVETSYTKTEINRMSTAELKALAIECGVENVEDMTGGEIKKVLIEKFGL